MVTEEIAEARRRGLGWTPERPMADQDKVFSCSVPTGRLMTGRCRETPAFISYSTTLAAAVTRCLSHWLEQQEDAERCTGTTRVGRRCRNKATTCRTHAAASTAPVVPAAEGEL